MSKQRKSASAVEEQQEYRGRKPVGGRALGEPITIKLPVEARAAMNEVAQAMGLELATACRMVIVESHGPYLQRVRRMARERMTAEANHD